ncbi:hypothetical protein [Craurococcus roseus]
MASFILVLLGGLLNAAGIEAGKMAALAWICARQWEDWVPLGAAFGLFKATGVLVSWALLHQTFGSLAPFSITLLVAATNVLLLHLALGRLAAGVARSPGNPWLAFGLASLASAAFTSGPAALLMLLPAQAVRFLDQQPLALLAVLLGFALLVRSRVPWPVEATATGPAREFLAGAGGLVVGSALVFPVAQALLAPNGLARLPGALLWAAALSFLTGLFARQVVGPWLRHREGR